MAASARADVAVKWVPDAQVVGSGRLSVMLWEVYDATLYAPQGVWNAGKPFALSLHYFRDIEGGDIADRSVVEMRKQGFSDEVILAGWHGQMRAIFPDVTRGTVLTAVYIPGKSTRFFRDGQDIGVITDSEFGKHFFNIWLAENTSEPGLRKKLLGLS
jgi:hypothetical protein